MHMRMHIIRSITHLLRHTLVDYSFIITLGIFVCMYYAYDYVDYAHYYAWHYVHYEYYVYLIITSIMHISMLMDMSVMDDITILL